MDISLNEINYLKAAITGMKVIGHKDGGFTVELSFINGDKMVYPEKMTYTEAVLEVDDFARRIGLPNENTLIDMDAVYKNIDKDPACALCIKELGLGT